jgi:hypothetical protein
MLGLGGTPAASAASNFSPMIGRNVKANAYPALCFVSRKAVDSAKALRVQLLASGSATIREQFRSLVATRTFPLTQGTTLRVLKLLGAHVDSDGNYDDRLELLVLTGAKEGKLCWLLDTTSILP